MNARYVEMASLGVIAILVAAGGKLVLANLSEHRAFAAIALVLVIIGCAFAMRRAYLLGAADQRVVVTKYVAYLVAAGLALWDVLAYAKWLPGSCIAAAVVALVFDVITIWQRPAISSEGHS